ncbi:MAG: hypothetical protein E6J88_20105, partial [Deltaproteobacteria bacterium]
MNRLLKLLVVSLVVALPAAAQNATCWNRDLERMDFFTNPPSRGDNTFFSFTVSGTANVTMLYPGTLSMRELPVSLYELRTGVTTPFDAAVSKGSGYGCSNSFLNTLEYFMPTTVDAPAANPAFSGPYSQTKSYPEPELTYAGGGGLNDCFIPADYNGTNGWAWGYKQWSATTSNNGKVNCPNSNSPPTGAADPTTACANAAGLDLVALADCKLCLGITTLAGFTPKGYWINYKKSNTDTSASAFLARGNWLDFFPPKWALLRLAYKRLVNGPLLNPLREGIVTNCTSTNTNYNSGQSDMGPCSDQGYFRLQKMLPQSCSGSGRPNQRIGSVDQVQYKSTSNPIAEMLYNVAWAVSADSNSSTPGSSWSISSADTHPASEFGASGEKSAKEGFCPGCNAGFSVLFSDGRGIDGWTNCDSADGGSLPAYCIDPFDGGVHNSHTACSGDGPGLGIEKDGDDFIRPDGGAGSAVTATTAPGYTVGGGTCPNDYLDDVAAWMVQNNMLSTQAGTNLRLYTIGIGDNFFGEQNILRSAASAGRGLYVRATDFASLERNINKVFLDIISNATSFSVAAITTVQTRGTTFAFIPRFRPLGGAQWEGRLYRFRLFNEFASGCGPDELTGGPDGGPKKDALNPNGNASCSDLYLQDADGGFVGEDDGGTFILLDTSQPFGDAGWPVMIPKTPAIPIWEAADVLTRREQSSSTLDGGSGPSRVILTVNMDAGYPTPPTTPASLLTFNDFSTNGVAVMTNYMRLGGVNSDFCVGLSSVTRDPYATKEDCGRDLMKFIDGQDVMRQNTDGGAVRPLILGDIFHSSPILVTPPVPTFLCETGIVNQCVRTLYAEDQPCPSGCTPNSKAAYASYFGGDAGTRQELLLVGANDGMLHAFQAGTFQGDAGYDDGTGEEVWAFIPPDMLPKLQRYALSESHNILVDGTPWVRDIWKDGSGTTTKDAQKQFDEFHTIAIIGEREGGRHYHALDVTDTSAQPKFLWTFPQPGSEIDLSQGESWNDTTPNPPSIGPILLKDTVTPGRINLGGDTQLEERWIVAISGGYDPNLVRGRAVYIVDAYDGTLLFKYSRYDVSNSSAPCPGASCEPRRNLGPVAAPVSLIDTDFDNFFDLVAFGDTLGNVQVIDMKNHGIISGTPPLVNNWLGGLAFQQFRGGAISQRTPFFTMAGARVFEDSKGGVRLYLGGGDRDQIKVRDTDAIDGGTCELDNLRGCIRNDCTVNVNQNTYTIGAGG